MITILLTGSGLLSNMISYSVSPLYELAASLHTLAQPIPPQRFVEWTEDKLAHFQIARLMRDWEYFMPLFRYGIPDSFDPLQTKGVMAVDDQYEYFVTLPTEQFVRSIQPALEVWNQHHDIPAVYTELQEDADYVKGRFSLFVSSYWQLSFEGNWEVIAPLFVREAEKIHRVVGELPELLAFLQGIDPGITYDAKTNRLNCPYSGPSHEVQQLVLYPSHYYSQEPKLSKKGLSAHLLYSFT
jgi:hypothetical protein